LFAGQSLVSAAVIAIGTVLTIIATQITGDAANAGLPNAVMSLASAPAAFGWGILWDRMGRRRGLALGMVLGVLGVGISLIAVQSRSFVLLLAGMAGIGFSRAAMQLARFIAAEVNPPDKRGRAISYVVLGGTVGAVGGPLLVAPSGKWALALGMNELAGPFFISVFLFIVGIATVYIGLNPEPMTLSKHISEQYPEKENGDGMARPVSALLRLPNVIVAMSAMVISQAVMVMVMGMTALHMSDHSHALNAISIVFAAHTLGMFAFSVLSGKLADSWGRPPVILAGIGMLLVSFVLAPTNPSTPVLAAALFLLGLGWNFCFVGGSALLADQLTPAERAKTQGFNDLLIGAVSAGGGYTSGLIYAGLGYGQLNLISGIITAFLLALTLWWRWVHLRKTPQAAQI
jgi:MFS family permease